MSDLKYGPLDQAALPLLEAAGQKTSGAPAWDLMDWAWRTGIQLRVLPDLLFPLREIVDLRADRIPMFLRPPGQDESEADLAEELSNLSPEEAAALLWDEADSRATETIQGYPEDLLKHLV